MACVLSVMSLRRLLNTVCCSVNGLDGLVWFGGDLNYGIDKQQVRTFDQWLMSALKDGRMKKGERESFATINAYTCWMIW